RAGGRLEIHAHLRGNNDAQRRLAQARRPIEQDVIYRLAASFGGVNQDAQIAFHLVLADVLFQSTRAQTAVKGDFFFAHFSGNNPVSHSPAPSQELVFYFSSFIIPED